ncbi:isoleucine--tRNA ligase [Metallosphaera javensis (ex Hofmann et al. 2022)]|uniref:isoleucine--tRNA ligase n=1 Tax=Metallosphaera javensis (ex Hofmann et al. 2022) TaxID=99938 RepID=UPI001EDEB738|nr:isoleucine--tRNA ligase [Metallosphaera javensis (ex Hofmann et al. 2022)]
MKPLQSKFEPLKIEKEVSDFWTEKNVYRTLKEYNGKFTKKFLFIDGPPYPSAPVPHIGTIWNKVIKDSILRYKRLEGYRVHDQPGYDTHGLPIEVAVEKKLNITQKRDIYDKVGVEKFVQLCRDFALTNLKSMSENFKNVGVFMDWENPYLTLDSTFISNSWAVIKRAHEKGLLAKDVQVLHWCPRCETTLSDYEVSEYKDIEDPSIYVKFRISGTQNKFLVIWTTTPWTLPSNVFVMINKDYNYAEVEVNNEVYIIAEQRVEAVMKEAKVQKFKVLRTFKGEEILGLRYEHPLRDLVPAQQSIDQYHVVVDGGDKVTLEDGTGLVHSAPGHGDVDFEVGKANGMPVVMLVNDRGHFTEMAGKYSGMNVRESASTIIQDLRDRGALLFAGKIVHRYPICWRCKSPLILRAIDQWFIKVTKLKSKLQSEIERVNWIPSWGRTRIGNMVAELRDWVISRQRFWGNPLPIWVCEKGHVNVVGSVEELKKVALNEVPKDLHKPWIDNVVIRCEKCGANAKRVPDVADVWFDSGVAFFSSLGSDWVNKWRELGPVDLVLEGHDQLRGWFFSLLRSGVILDDRAPYEAVLVHGFMLDEQGREMHKSLGNYVEPSVVIEKYGRDVLRLMLLKNTTWEDVKFSEKNLELSQRDLQIAWNVFLFTSMYMNLDNFNPREMSLDEALEQARVEDRWIVSRFYNMRSRVHEAMKDYKVHELANELMRFMIEDVSRFYLRLARKRAWEEGLNKDKQALYTILYHILREWLIMASAVIPYFAEKVYQNFVVNDKKLSVSMETLGDVRRELIDNELEASVELMKIITEASLNARAKANIKLRWPVSTAHIFLKDGKLKGKLEENKELLKTLLNSKELKLYDMAKFYEFSELNIYPDKGAIGKEYKRLSPKIVQYVENNKDVIARDILEKGFHTVFIDDTEVKLTTSHLRITEEVKPEYASGSFELGVVLIPKEIGGKEEEEGIVRDVIRRIQYMRKLMNLNVTDYIIVNIVPPQDRVQLLEKYRDYISSETRSKEIVIGQQGGDQISTWDIEGEEYIIGIRKV